MKKIFTLLFLMGVSLCVSQLAAQDIDRSFVFVDENGNELENGATVVRNQVEDFDGAEVINSGLAVRQNDAAAYSFLRVRYRITTLDNGTYQLCFPISCTKQSETGEYETTTGSLMFNPQDLQSEWFPDGDGTCIVELKIEVMNNSGGFPPSYVYAADGPSLTLKFVKSSQSHLDGDVNGDGNVNISDINAIIDMILSGSFLQAGDINGDSSVNIADINALIALILNP